MNQGNANPIDSFMESPLIEEWKLISGSDGLYTVSSRGRIRSHFNGREYTLSPCKDTKGYLQFAMSLPGRKRVRMKVHQAVALTFLGPRPAEAQINHRSGDKTDNSVINLEYVSCRENVRHAWRKGLRTAEQVQGERHGKSKLTCEYVREIRKCGGKATLVELAKRYGVSSSCIHSVIKNRTWQHVS